MPKAKPSAKARIATPALLREQVGGEHRQPFAALGAGAASRAAPRGSAPGRAAVGELAGDQRVVPVAVARDEQPADRGAGDHHRERDAQLEPDRAHRRAPFAAEEAPQPADQRGARAVDLEPGAPHQRFEIGQRAGIERGLARDREARGGLAVEHRQREQVLVGDAPQAVLLERDDDRLEPPPVGLALEPEAVGAQARRLDVGRRHDLGLAEQRERHQPTASARLAAR